ncbi:hypothetical protein ACIHAA_08255 [Streptomyces sp. NPDC052040]|uniref:hypothetical protein n=1 Tax=Streptomyces sp. NPDC052040 TaxID=3365682 RepID=UPI0037D51613
MRTVAAFRLTLLEAVRGRVEPGPPNCSLAVLYPFACSICFERGPGYGELAGIGA